MDDRPAGTSIERFQEILPIAAKDAARYLQHLPIERLKLNIGMSHIEYRNSDRPARAPDEKKEQS